MTRKVMHGSTRFADVAQLIAPNNTPAWLAEMLRDWAPSVALDRYVQATQPTKAEMKKRLLDIRDAALLLQRTLSDAPMREFLEIEGSIRIENVGGLDHTLRTIAERAERAAASPTITTAAGETKKGRGKALPLEAISAKAFCALIIAETWAYIREGQPAPRNQEAAAAAHAYWQASGGTTQSWGSDPRIGWSYHFKEAQSPAAERWRKEVLRHCVEHTRWVQYLATDGK